MLMNFGKEDTVLPIPYELQIDVYILYIYLSYEYLYITKRVGTQSWKFMYAQIEMCTRKGNKRSHNLIGLHGL
jgi:hypothetical protein